MTRKSLLVLGVMVAATLMTPRQSEAVIGWLEELSGPGPFLAVQLPADRVICIARGSNENLGVASAWGSARDKSAAQAACARDDPRGVKAFVSVEFPIGRSRENQLFPQDPKGDRNRVTLIGVRPVFFVRATPGVDLGAGIGFTRFSGDAFDSFTRVTIPLRARIVPAAFNGKASRATALYIALQGDLYPKMFTAADFGARGNWTEDNDFQVSVFLGLDILRLFRD